MSDEAMLAISDLGPIEYTIAHYEEFAKKICERAALLGGSWTAQRVEQALFSRARVSRFCRLARDPIVCPQASPPLPSSSYLRRDMPVMHTHPSPSSALQAGVMSEMKEPCAPRAPSSGKRKAGTGATSTTTRDAGHATAARDEANEESSKVAAKRSRTSTASGSR